MATQVSIGRGTTLTRFTGPSDDPDRLRFEIYSDARGMNRDDALELMIELAAQMRAHPAPNGEAELKFANDTAELLLDANRRLRDERDAARRALDVVVGA